MPRKKKAPLDDLSGSDSGTPYLGLARGFSMPDDPAYMERLAANRDNPNTLRNRGPNQDWLGSPGSIWGLGRRQIDRGSSSPLSGGNTPPGGFVPPGGGSRPIGGSLRSGFRRF